MRIGCSIIVLSLLALCACRPDAEESFPQPQYGKDTCAECGSTVRDPNFAAFYQSPGGAKVFDDPGCLLRSLRAEDAGAVKPLFHQHGGARWLSGDEVFFAKTPTTQSPQGYGWAAYAGFGDAQTAVTSAGAGEIRSFLEAKDKIGADSR